MSDFENPAAQPYRPEVKRAIGVIMEIIREEGFPLSLGSLKATYSEMLTAAEEEMDTEALLDALQALLGTNGIAIGDSIAWERGQLDTLPDELLVDHGDRSVA